MTIDWDAVRAVALKRAKREANDHDEADDVASMVVARMFFSGAVIEDPLRVAHVAARNALLDVRKRVSTRHEQRVCDGDDVIDDATDPLSALIEHEERAARLHALHRIRTAAQRAPQPPHDRKAIARAAARNERRRNRWPWGRAVLALLDAPSKVPATTTYSRG